LRKISQKNKGGDKL
jgi:hypothetical protein